MSWNEHKDQLFKKVEFSKRKKAEQTENKLWEVFQSEKEPDEMEKKLIFSSLEYTFKKRLRENNIIKNNPHFNEWLELFEDYLK